MDSGYCNESHDQMLKSCHSTPAVCAYECCRDHLPITGNQEMPEGSFCYDHMQSRCQPQLNASGYKNHTAIERRYSNHHESLQGKLSSYIQNLSLPQLADEVNLRPGDTAVLSVPTVGRNCLTSSQQQIGRFLLTSLGTSGNSYATVHSSKPATTAVRPLEDVQVTLTSQRDQNDVSFSSTRNGNGTVSAIELTTLSTPATGHPQQRRNVCQACGQCVAADCSGNQAADGTAAGGASPGQDQMQDIFAQLHDIKKQQHVLARQYHHSMARMQATMNNQSQHLELLERVLTGQLDHCVVHSSQRPAKTSVSNDGKFVPKGTDSGSDSDQSGGNTPAWCGVDTSNMPLDANTTTLKSLQWQIEQQGQTTRLMLAKIMQYVGMQSPGVESIGDALLELDVKNEALVIENQALSATNESLIKQVTTLQQKLANAQNLPRNDCQKGRQEERPSRSQGNMFCDQGRPPGA